MRYFLEISYNGTAYAGWQQQKNKSTVHGEIIQSLKTILQNDFHSIGCGRTDAGVHAKQFFMHLDLAPKLPKHFLHRLNKILPKDIAIHRLMEVAPRAHARFDASSRVYEYHLHFQNNPFLNGQSAFFPWHPLDLEAMQAGAQLLLKYEDFLPFCRRTLQSKTSLCELQASEWILSEDKQHLKYRIASNRFLRGMVRRIVGCLILIGKQKLSLDHLQAVLEQKEDFQQSFSVPAYGLYLTKVHYPYLTIA